MAKASNQPAVDVLVIGEHPAAYFAAALLKQKSKLNVLHATLPGEQSPDRLVVVNPEMFDLHPLLTPWRRKLEMTTIYGLSFLSDDPTVRSEYHGKSTMTLVASYKDIKAAMIKVAQGEGVEFATPRAVHVHRLDENGLEVTLGKQRVRPRVMVLGAHLSKEQEKVLGMPEAWGQDVVHRYTFLKFKGMHKVDLGPKCIIPMSLDLMGKLYWGWLLPCGQTIQIAVEQPVETVNQIPPKTLLLHWINVLKKQNVLKPDIEIPMREMDSMDLPFAGALAHEGLANRTLLVGPAGGFYSASGEDVYPNIWSAVFAAEAIKKAWNEKHLQDALQSYRHEWRTTLGDYLRGPQQNLKFLLPLVYRNQVMTTRLSEAILQGKGMNR